MGTKKAKAKKRYKSKLNTRTQPRTQPRNGIKAAPKDGPSLSLRMRNRDAIRGVRGAAVKAGMSMNTWACEVLERAVAASA
jgi:predicted HicB family RNase H-like nuclease